MTNREDRNPIKFLRITSPPPSVPSSDITPMFKSSQETSPTRPSLSKAPAQQSISSESVPAFTNLPTTALSSSPNTVDVTNTLLGSLNRNDAKLAAKDKQIKVLEKALGEMMKSNTMMKIELEQVAMERDAYERRLHETELHVASPCQRCGQVRGPKRNLKLEKAASDLVKMYGKILDANGDLCSRDMRELYEELDECIDYQFMLGFPEDEISIKMFWIASKLDKRFDALLPINFDPDSYSNLAGNMLVIDDAVRKMSKGFETISTGE